MSFYAHKIHKIHAKLSVLKKGHFQTEESLDQPFLQISSENPVVRPGYNERNKQPDTTFHKFTH